MAIKNALTSFFYGGEPVEPISPATTETTKGKQTTPKSTPQQTTTTILPVIPGQPDPQIAQILEEAIAQANLNGFDYFELKQCLANLASIPLTVEQRYNAAFASALAMGVSKDSLLKSVDHYIVTVQNKQIEFQQFLDQSINKEIATKEEKIASLNAGIQDKVKQIEELTKSIQDSKAQQDALTAEVNQQKLESQQKSVAFDATVQDIVKKMQADKQNIETFLK
jgi:flagellar motility protein MotE (MotC chaperone)